MKPIVSIIVCSYNGASFLEHYSLPSVIAQSYHDWELIIVDDGSTDHTADVVAQFQRQSPAIIHIRHSVNRGLGAAMNTGIGASTGRYLAFLEQDDIWLSGKLEVQMRAFAANPNYRVGWVHAWRFDQGKRALYNVRPADFSGLILERKALEQIGLFEAAEDLLGIESDEFRARLTIARHQGIIDPSSVFILPQPLLIYVRHPKSLSVRYNFGPIARRYSALISRYHQPRYRSNPGLRRMMSYNYLHLGFNETAQGHRRAALRALTQAFRIRPHLPPLILLTLVWLPPRVFIALHRLYLRVQRTFSMKTLARARREWPGLAAESDKIISALNN